MKIALIAPVEETIPPQKYGGTEWIVYAIAHGMGKKGYEIDLYAAGDSKKEDYYTLVPIVSQSLRSDIHFAKNLKLRETGKFIAIADTLKLLQQKKYDIIHNHNSWRFLTFANLLSPTPIVTTHHGPLSSDYQNIVFNKYKDLPYVSISDNQRKDLPYLHFVATIYNGINVHHYPMVDDASVHQYPNMLFLARMSPEKGAIEAASVALKLQKKLIVAAKVDEVDNPYFASFHPLIDNNLVTFVGEIEFEQKLAYLQTAKLLLAPIKWEEPFGLMFTEAMAVGTPVVAFARGAAPEIIVDGVTGFLVNESEENSGDWIIKKTGVEGLCEAVERIYALSPEEYKNMKMNCRNRVEEKFTDEKMVDAYEKVYHDILST